MFLGARFERTSETSNLEEAIDKARHVVQSTLVDHLDIAMYINNLGSWLGKQFKRSSEVRDLEEAIYTARRVV